MRVPHLSLLRVLQCMLTQQASALLHALQASSHHQNGTQEPSEQGWDQTHCQLSLQHGGSAASEGGPFRDSRSAHICCCALPSLQAAAVRACVCVCTGLQVTNHTFQLPLDHSQPEGPKIAVMAREVVSLSRSSQAQPYLLYLQGAQQPGTLCSPRNGLSRHSHLQVALALSLRGWQTSRPGSSLPWLSSA